MILHRHVIETSASNFVSFQRQKAIGWDQILKIKTHEKNSSLLLFESHCLPRLFHFQRMNDSRPYLDPYNQVGGYFKNML